MCHLQISTLLNMSSSKSFIYIKNSIGRILIPVVPHSEQISSLKSHHLLLLSLSNKLVIENKYNYLGINFNYNGRFSKTIRHLYELANRTMLCLISKARKLIFVQDSILTFIPRCYVVRPNTLQMDQLFNLTSHAKLTEICKFVQEILNSLTCKLIFL